MDRGVKRKWPVSRPLVFHDEGSPFRNQQSCATEEANMTEPSLAHPVASALAKAPMDDEAVTCSDAEAVAEGERDVENGRVVATAELRAQLGL